MNLGRRVVLLLALAATLAVVAATLSHILVEPPDGGWVMYAPNGSSGVPFVTGDSDGDALRVAPIWLVAIGVWFGVAWRLFRGRDE